MWLEKLNNGLKQDHSLNLQAENMKRKNTGSQQNGGKRQKRGEISWQPVLPHDDGAKRHKLGESVCREPYREHHITGSACCGAPRAEDSLFRSDISRTAAGSRPLPIICPEKLSCEGFGGKAPISEDSTWESRSRVARKVEQWGEASL